MKLSELFALGSSQEEIKWKLLGEESFSKQLPKTELEFHDAVFSGIPVFAVDNLADLMEIPLAIMGNLLNVSYKTLTQKNKTELLDPMVSSCLYEITNTIVKGMEVFEDDGRLNEWLNEENEALKDRRPLDMMYTPTGIKLVNQLLDCIEEGVCS